MTSTVGADPALLDAYAVVASELARRTRAAVDELERALSLAHARCADVRLPDARALLAATGEHAAAIDRLGEDVAATAAALRSVDAAPALRSWIGDGAVSALDSITPVVAAPTAGLVARQLLLSGTRLPEHLWAAAEVRRLDHALTTAADFLDGRRLPRPVRRELMHEHNRPILHALRRARPRAAAAASRLEEPLTGLGARLRTRLPRTFTRLRAGGKLLGFAGIALNVVDLVGDARRGDHGGAASNVAAGVGGALMLFGGPPGIAVGAVLVAGSLAYEYREELGAAARWTGRSAGDLHRAARDGVSSVASFLNPFDDEPSR